MPSQINASNSGFGGIVSTGDSSGVLELQTTGTTAVTIDTSQRVGFVAGTAAAPAITRTGDTNTGMFFPAADTIAFAEGGTESMRLDSNGNVGIGTTNMPALLTVQTSATGTTAGSNVIARLQSNATGRDATLQFSDNVSNSATISMLSGATAFRQNGVESMRIDSAGNVLIGQTTNANGAKLAITGNGGGTTDDLTFNSTASYSDIQSYNNKPLCLNRIGNEVWINGGTDRGAFALQVNTSGVWGAGAYTNGSDARIKEDIAPINSCLDIVTKLNPVTYKYKEDWSRDQSTQTGFVAQDLLVALEGENYVDGVVKQDSEYMSVAYQNIIPILTKAIQEQQAIINDLKARIETLEAK